MMRDSRRRRILQAAVGWPLLGWQAAFAQTPGRTLVPGPRPSSPGVASASGGVITAPRRALVIGNSAYSEGPLRNPASDARAIANELNGQGFEVVLGLDLRRDEMLKLIGDYSAGLAQTKPVALFYFAGHGLQLAWRNYLVPVDASIKSAADVQAQCFDVNSLIDGIRKARNPMNVIILDACRDDPFGKSEQKGLSQLDAPPGTLLAYATSPGNTASDGDGANGLYTEHLLREMKVPEAKIEDVFKRVRLGVRRRSNGEQIPWESTSLEEDFWFIPPRDVRKAAEAEAERTFQQELALWEKIDGAQDVRAFEDYLRRYPSGRFTEIAQMQLDELLRRQGEKRIEAASQAGNPFTQGSARADLAYKVGDSYSYIRMKRETRELIERIERRVAEITDRHVIFGKGQRVMDRLGNLVRQGDGRRFSPRQDEPLEYFVGKRWSTRFTSKIEGRGHGGETDQVELDYRITRRERVTVAAGTFDCFVTEAQGYVYTPGGMTLELRLKNWKAPGQVRGAIISEQFRKVHATSGRAVSGRMPGTVLTDERIELVAYTQS
jgi:uncharacterized caspase-like protein